MNGLDIQRYDMVQKLIVKLGLFMQPVGEFIDIENTNGNTLGRFSTIDDVYYFLLGYEWGMNSK